MTNKLPKFLDKHKICIICEGNEEYEYLNRLKALKVWNEQYDISLVNAEGNGNIPARYQDSYQNGAYEVVLVFCDTEKKWISSARLMSFMALIMPQRKLWYLQILVPCRL